MADTPPPTILVVDDDVDIRGTLSELLEAEGYRVATAGNGAEALEALRRAQRPSLILLDLMMPVMSGWQFLTERGKDEAIASIPVAVISASINFKPSVEGFDVAASLSKPIDFDRLLETVQRWAGKAGGADAR